MKELIKMFYPDVERGTFPVENLNTIPASAFFSCASTATGAPNASHGWIGLQINNEADENSVAKAVVDVTNPAGVVTLYGNTGSIALDRTTGTSYRLESDGVWH